MPTRSEIMAAVRSSGTGPELVVARGLREAGVRGVSRQAASLPGRPDFVVRRARVAIFVHGCFWHGHACPRGARTPRANRAYWVNKIARNAARDRRVARELRARGWSVWTLWACRLRPKRRGDAWRPPARLLRAIEARSASV